MMRSKKHNKQDRHSYNLDKLDAIVTVALIADSKNIHVPKKLYKLAKQMLAVRNLTDKISIKTY